MNNKRLEPKSDPRYTIREEILPGGVVSDLSIRRTERSDSALFTCVATNAFGSDDTSINMIIQGNTVVFLKSICITTNKTAYKYTYYCYAMYTKYYSNKFFFVSQRYPKLLTD